MTTPSLPARAFRFVRRRADPRPWLRHQVVCAGPWWRERAARRQLALLDEEGLKKTVRSDTAFVFGSGASLRDLTPAEWAHIGRHDTIGFNYFIRQRFVRLDFHIVGEVATGDDTRREIWEPAVRQYAEIIESNPFCRDTIVGLQQGWRAHQSNRLIALGLVPPSRRVFRYRRIGRGVLRRPSPSLVAGLVHGAGSVCGAVNLAYAMGFRRIVLTGIDLYDSRYFWLNSDEARGDLVELGRPDPSARHPTASSLIRYLGAWRAQMQREGVELTVYNPRSLLTETLPVYAAPARLGHTTTMPGA